MPPTIHRKWSGCNWNRDRCTRSLSNDCCENTHISFLSSYELPPRDYLGTDMVHFLICGTKRPFTTRRMRYAEIIRRCIHSTNLKPRGGQLWQRELRSYW